MNRKDRKLYKRHLRDLQKEDPEIKFIFDITKEDANWIKRAQPEEEDEDA